MKEEQKFYQEYLNKVSYELSALKDCLKNCSFCKKKAGPVLGGGYPLADIFLLKGLASFSDVGAGNPFAKEDDALRKAFGVLGINYDFVYKTCALKCIPQEGASDDFLHGCASYLREEIEIVLPKIVVVFGKTAWKIFTLALDIMKDGPFQPGKIERLPTSLFSIVTYDFSTSLEDTLLKQKLWQHLKVIKKFGF